MTYHSTSSKYKQNVIDAYNTASGGFDLDTRRFFRACANRLVELVGISVGDRVLDIATGTGAGAFAAARVTSSGGHVVGVDFAPQMLARARRVLSETGLQNIDFLEMDAEHLGFPDASFDSATCAFSIFYMPDMLTALREWRRVLKHGGRFGFSSLSRNAFQPFSDLYEARARHYGAALPEPNAFAWQRLTSPEECNELLSESGFEDVRVYVEQHGYHLRDFNDWWEIVWNGSWRQAISHLSPEQVKQFKSNHLTELQAVESKGGLWLNVEAIFAVGQKS